jgi:hypothetical protein
MPNSGHYTLCPYYKYDRHKTIYCEDCPRRFTTEKDKHEYMRQYCDDKFEQCNHAKRITETWEEVRKAPEKGQLLFAEHQVREYRKEVQKLTKIVNHYERVVNVGEVRPTRK